MFETALVTGDASGLDSSGVALGFALQYLAAMSSNSDTALSDIYGDTALTYTPSNYGQWVETTDYQNNFTLVFRGAG